MTIIQVEKESVGAAAGFAVGDVLVAMDGTPLDQKETYNRLMSEKRWGDSARFEVLRGGVATTLTAYFRRTPDTPPISPAAPVPPAPPDAPRYRPQPRSRRRRHRGARSERSPPHRVAGARRSADRDGGERDEPASRAPESPSRIGSPSSSTPRAGGWRSTTGCCCCAAARSSSCSTGSSRSPPRFHRSRRCRWAKSHPSTATTVAAADLPPAGATLRRYRVRLPAGGGKLHLTYAGKFDFGLGTQQEEYQRGFRDTAGIVSPDGGLPRRQRILVRAVRASADLVEFELTARAPLAQRLAPGEPGQRHLARRPGHGALELRGERRGRSEPGAMDEIYLVGGPLRALQPHGGAVGRCRRCRWVTGDTAVEAEVYPAPGGRRARRASTSRRRRSTSRCTAG